jgi:hypothetical protein
LVEPFWSFVDVVVCSCVGAAHDLGSVSMMFTNCS